MYDLARNIKTELAEDLGSKVVHHRNNFRALFTARYLEILPSLIQYTVDESNSDILESINFLLLEYALRDGKKIVIGESKQNESEGSLTQLEILGFVKREKKETEDFLCVDKRLTGEDIYFTISEKRRLDNYLEISNADNCTSGNFVIIQNKYIEHVSDFQIVNHYANHLAEIVCSRFSLALQAKVLTIFLGEENDQATEKFISDIFNGRPFVKASDLFDADSDIFVFQNNHASASLDPLKKEYQNVLSELNNMLGIETLAVEKESGVSDTEVKGNQAYIKSNANIYLESRNEALLKLEKRYFIRILSQYNDNVRSELNRIGALDHETNDKTI